MAVNKDHCRAEHRNSSWAEHQEPDKIKDHDRQNLSFTYIVITECNGQPDYQDRCQELISSNIVVVVVKLFIFGYSLNKITVHTRLRYYCIDRSGGSPQRA